MGLLADGRHIEKAIVALNHSEEVQKHENKLAELRKEKELVEKYFAPGAPLSYPNSLFFLSALRWAAMNTTDLTENAVVSVSNSNYALKPGLGEKWVEETHKLLKEFFTGLKVGTPATPEDALKQSAAIEAAIQTFKYYLSQNFNYASEAKDPMSWPTPKEFLKIREDFLKYFESNPDPKEIWRYLTETRGFKFNPRAGGGQYWVHINWATITSGGVKMHTSFYKLPNPRVQENPGLRVHLGLGRSIDWYNKADIARLDELSKEIRKEEKAIAKLVGKAPPPPQRPVLAAYTTPPSVEKALGPEASVGGGAKEALRYREGLIAKYLSGGGFFASAQGKAILADPDKYESAFSSFSPSRIPVVREDGTYDLDELARFREHAKSLGVTPEAFVDYSRELHELSEDPKAKSELAAILKDRIAGNPQLLVLRELAGSHDRPAPELSSARAAAGSEPSDANPVAPYARPLTPELSLHNALTDLARETAQRGARATGTELLRDLAKASRDLDKDLRRDSLPRGKAIEKLSPPIDRALAEAQSLGIDLAQMQSHAEAIHREIGNLQKAATERAKSLNESARNPGAADLLSLPAALEEISMQLDQLKSQETDTQYLLRSLTALRATLRESREYLLNLQSLIRRADPLHPNQIDNRMLLEALNKLPREGH